MIDELNFSATVPDTCAIMCLLWHTTRYGVIIGGTIGVVAGGVGTLPPALPLPDEPLPPEPLDGVAGLVSSVVLDGSLGLSSVVSCFVGEQVVVGSADDRKYSL